MSNKTKKSEIKHLIHLVGGEKGGAGKTLFARTLIQYCLDRQVNFRAVEADLSNPDVANVYKGVCDLAQFSADEKQQKEADMIFEWALEKSIVVNLPSQSYKFVKRWIDKNDLIELGAQNGVGFVQWFACTGGYDSVQLFLTSLSESGGKIPHVLVKNMGLRDDWSGVENGKEFKKITAQCKLHSVIEFPKLDYFERDTIDKERLRFDVAKDCFDFDFGIVNRQRIHNFLRDAYKEIDKTKLFDGEMRRPSPPGNNPPTLGNPLDGDSPDPASSSEGIDDKAA